MTRSICNTRATSSSRSRRGMAWTEFSPPEGAPPREGNERMTMGDQKRAVQRQFGRQAGAYARTVSHRRDADLDLLITHLHATPRDRVLDVATGTGFTAFALRPHVRAVVGGDLIPCMLGEARRVAAAGDGLPWLGAAA